MINNTLLILSSLNVTVCETEDCKNVASLLSLAMNKTIDPCENFYEYVCGSWSEICPISEEYSNCNIDTEFEDAIQMSLQGILEGNPGPNDTKALSIERKWFNACMNEARIEKKGYKPVTKHLKNIGGWPIVMNPTKWKDEEFPWQKVAQYYARISGKYSLFTISQYLNPNNTENKMLMFDKFNGVQLPWTYENSDDDDDDDNNNDDDDDDDLVFHNDNDVDYLNHKFGLRNSFEDRNENNHNDSYDDNYDDFNDDESYSSDYDYEYDTEELIVSVLEDYAKSSGGYVKNIRDQVKEMLEFEDVLFQIISECRKEEPRSVKTVMTIGEFQNLYDSHGPDNSVAKIDWLEMVRVLSNNSGTYIDESEKILLFRKSYFEKLVPLLNKTPNRVIINYLHMIFFQDALVYLDKEKRPWYPDIDGEERPEYCLEHMMGLYFNTGFSQVFIENYFSDDIKESANEIAEDVRNQVKADIFTSKWLDDEAKQLINDKLESMKFHIGYPDYYKNKTFLNHMYDGLKVGPDYFENVINMLTFDNDDFWREFREPFDKDQFLENPTVINAFYSEFDNSLSTFYFFGISTLLL